MMLDMDKNRIPETVRTIHLIAVCGTGMGALACMLRDLGFEVTGSDQKIYPPMSHFLEKKGIRIMDGFREENISYAPDLVIVGNAVVRENPEVGKLHRMGLNFCSMPQALNRFVAGGKKTLLVSGTHGKTTDYGDRGFGPSSYRCARDHTGGKIGSLQWPFDRCI